MTSSSGLRGWAVTRGTNFWILAAGERSYDLVTTHFLHPPDGGMVGVTRRLAEAVAPGGHLLVVGHAPSQEFTHLTASYRRAMFVADELLLGLPGDSRRLWSNGARGQ